MVADLAGVAAEETYTDVQQMIRKECWAFSRRGLDWDECLGEANLAFARAYKTFDGREAQFITWAYWSVHTALLELWRKESIRRARYHELPETDAVSARRGSILQLLLADLSDDARTVVHLVVETPPELAGIVRMRQKKKALRCLWNYLRQMGWSAARCINSFDEIKEALTA